MEIALGKEIEGPAQLLGYRAMHKKLREQHNLVLPRDLVLDVMGLVNPEGLQRREDLDLSAWGLPENGTQEPAMTIRVKGSLRAIRRVHQYFRAAQQNGLQPMTTSQQFIKLGARDPMFGPGDLNGRPLAVLKHPEQRPSFDLPLPVRDQGAGRRGRAAR